MNQQKCLIIGESCSLAWNCSITTCQNRLPDVESIVTSECYYSGGDGEDYCKGMS